MAEKITSALFYHDLAFHIGNRIGIWQMLTWVWKTELYFPYWTKKSTEGAKTYFYLSITLGNIIHANWKHSRSGPFRSFSTHVWQNTHVSPLDVQGCALSVFLFERFYNFTKGFVHIYIVMKKLRPLFLYFRTSSIIYNS